MIICLKRGMGPVVRFLYYVSVLVFSFHLFFSYYQFGDFVAVGYEDSVDVKKYYSKATIFYAGGVLFIVFNVLGIWLKALIKEFPIQRITLRLFDYWRQDLEHVQACREHSITWLNSWICMLNLLLSSVYLFLFLVNVVEILRFEQIGIFYYLYIPVVACWWVILWVRLSVKKIYL